MARTPTNTNKSRTRTNTNKSRTRTKPAAEAEESKAMAVSGSAQNALANFDMGADAGAGMEGTDRESFAIPFLRVLQSNSPQVDESDAAYVEGAKPGMLYNTVTNRLYDGKTGLVFIQVAYQRKFIRWAPRGTEPAYRGEYEPAEVAAMREEGELKAYEGREYIPLEDGTVDEKRCDRMVDTRSHFGLIEEEDGDLSQVVMPLSSTQIKKSKQLMSSLSQVKVRGANGLTTPPTWVNRIRLTTVRESNDQGAWFGVKPTPEGFIASQELYDAGKAFHDSVMGGAVRADYAQAEEAAAAPDAAGADNGKF